MAHNLGPSQTDNFFSNEPLTDATKKAIQAQGVEPTREAYTNRFMHKFENTATPEEKRPTVQKKVISIMTDTERKAYADKLFPDYATEGSIKPTEKKVDMVKEPILSTAEVKNKQDVLQKLLDDSKTYTTILAKGRQTEDTAKDLAKTNKQIAVIRKELSLSEDRKNNSVFESPITQPILSNYDRSMARRNYLQAARTGKPFNGRTADEWKALIK